VALFSAIVGPLVTPRRVVDAILDGDADAGPLDSYVHDLLRLHEPELARRLRVVATTPATPIPPLVAAPGMAADVAERIADALIAAGESVALDAIRSTLQLERFARVSADDYRVLRTDARHADDLGYKRLA
jgi:ABC-type phosphate/phosphonate transport system substrate-binding protein